MACPAHVFESLYIFVLEVLKLRMDPDLRYQLPVTVEQQIFQVNYKDYFAIADQNLQKDSWAGLD